MSIIYRFLVRAESKGRECLGPSNLCKKKIINSFMCDHYVEIILIMVLHCSIY